ncbi:hypothetical protein YTPLAS18_25980 [Nitrospira sp.]|nr:hypothetical protein YTPLAS18_25980 [Nitrospira sp.]
MQGAHAAMKLRRLSMMALHLAALLSAVFGAEDLLASAESRPFWTEQAMFRFGDDLYFVGVASCAKSSEDGRQAAFESGLKELGAYARDRETARLMVETTMIYEEPNAENCIRSTTSVWRLLRVNQATIAALPPRELKPGAPAPPGTDASDLNSDREVASLDAGLVQDLTPRPGMTREHLAQRFGEPSHVRRQRGQEIWEYGQSGLTITFSPDETLVSWTLAGQPDSPPEVGHASQPASQLEGPTTEAIARASGERLGAEPANPSVSFTPVPLAPNPIEEGRRLFNGKGACHTCHGRDADMYTDVRRDPLLGMEPGYIPPVIAPFGPSPRRVPPNLRDWFALRIRTDLELYRAIKNGIGGSAMTGTRHLSDREISDLIAYLNSLR